jgi:hypothetical protein
METDKLIEDIKNQIGKSISESDFKKINGLIKGLEGLVKIQGEEGKNATKRS